MLQEAGQNQFATDIQSESGGFYKDMKKVDISDIKFRQAYPSLYLYTWNLYTTYLQWLLLFQIVDLHEYRDPQCSLLSGGGLMKVLAWDIQCQILMDFRAFPHLQLGSTVEQ